MSNQVQISTLVGIIVIVTVSVVLFGGIFIYQYVSLLSTQIVAVYPE